LSWEVRGASSKPLLHLWAGNCNVTRRVLAITDQSDERIMLAVERFGRAAPDRMEIVRLNYQRSTKRISREDFCEQLRRVLAENFPDETVEKISTAADLEHSLSGMYARGTSRKGGMRAAFLAVPEGESQDAIESSLTFALLHEREVVLRFRGLPFARWKAGQIFFGRRSAWRRHGLRNEQELQQLIRDLKTFRNPLASDLRHPLYRAQAERWMQAIVMKDVSQLDVSLDPEHVYEQVIAESGGYHGVLDLLAMTGRTAWRSLS
jgi:hypothetical protein